MDYKLTFEDGSSGYLAHYGVKGMKWKKLTNLGKDQDRITNTDLVVGRDKIRDQGTKLSSTGKTSKAKKTSKKPKRSGGLKSVTKLASKAATKKLTKANATASKKKILSALHGRIVSGKLT